MNLKVIAIALLATLIGWLSALVYPPERLNPNFKEMVWFKNDVIVSPEQSEFFGKISRGSKCKQMWAKGFYIALSCNFLVESENISESNSQAQ